MFQAYCPVCLWKPSMEHHTLVVDHQDHDELNYTLSFDLVCIYCKTTFHVFTEMEKPKAQYVSSLSKMDELAQEEYYPFGQPLSREDEEG